MSSISKAPSTSNDIIAAEVQEESGWTMYLEDFSNNHNHHDQKCSISLSGVASSSSSLVSGPAATSLAAKELADREQGEEFSVNKNGNRSSFKKRKRIITSLVEDDLEDTASSPINSPKEKGNTSGQRSERKELGFNGRDSDCTELNKKGLCLVPFSMVANFLG